MSKLPRTEELPRSEEGYDAVRVEEAFAAFADRVRELESVASELRDELHSLRAERVGARRALAPFDSTPFEEEEWPVEPGDGNPGVGPAPEWVASVPVPVIRPLTIPRIVLEAAFLLLVALFAGLADLSATWIAIVMASAWALVAVSEWAAAAKRARWRLEAVADSVALTGEPASESTGPWKLPVLEATAIELPDVSESHTVIAPPPVEPVAEDEPAETPKPPRRLRLPRRRKAEPATDPWEV